MMVDPVLGNETLDPDNETHSHTRFSPQVIWEITSVVSIDLPAARCYFHI